MKLGFYPGCSMQGSSPEYNESLTAITKQLGIPMETIADWNCCGATAAHNLNKSLSQALPARIIALAEKQNLDEILVPCAACYNRLRMVQHDLHNKSGSMQKINTEIQLNYTGNIRILNILQFIEKYLVPALKDKITKPFKHMIACYYGCLLVRPQNILKAERYEDPLGMENILNELGAETIDWAFKTECCGAGLSVSRTDLVVRLSGEILEDAVARGAEAIVVACPMCHSNLDMRRKAINKLRKDPIAIPVIYITQVIGLAMGIPAKELGLTRHFVPVNMEF
jgi:heterodisulfide reductase subunit B2